MLQFMDRNASTSLSTLAAQLTLSRTEVRETATGHELAKPECRPIAPLTLRRASRSIGFRPVETDKPSV
jgi:hypothetical protein